MKWLLYILLFFIGVGTGFLIPREPKLIAYGIPKIDTIRDTIRDSIPYPIDSVIARYKVLPNPINHKGDTIHDTLILPITQKEYNNGLYHAWVSGYDAQLDSIHVFRETVIKTIPIKPRKWSIGIQGGYGMTNKGLSPYIGIGVSYRLY